MKNILLMGLGTTLMLASLWGGAYGMYLYRDEHWANVPCFITAYAVFFVGVGLWIQGFSALQEDRRG